MSRVGNNPIQVPNGVQITLDGNNVVVKGQNGELSKTFKGNITIQLENSVISVIRSDENPGTKSLHGLTRTLINNMILGVSQGFEKRLQLVGTGYRVQQKGQSLEMSLGFSHLVNVDPLGANVLKADGQTGVIVSGPDKQTVGDQAARIRKIRKPNPYSGKGILYFNEVVKRKAGKVVNQKTQTVMASRITDASLDEYRQQHPNRDLLGDLAEGTGGQMDVKPEDLVTQKQEGTRKILHPMQNMMMIAAVFLLLGDISLRTLFGPPAE